MINRNNYFRDQYRLLMKCLMVLIFICMGLVSAMVYTCFVQQQPNFYASTTNGEQVLLHPLSEAVMTDDLLIKWTEVAAKSAYNINFSSYQKDLDRVKEDFTSQGWSSYNSALESSGLLDDVISKKLILSAIVTNSPVIIQRGTEHGVFYWVVQMPMMVNESSASQTVKQTILVTVKITRVVGLDTAPAGILISSFVTSKYDPIGSVGA